jgi:hypothetical protein
MMSRIKIALAWAISLIVVYAALTWLYGVLDRPPRNQPEIPSRPAWCWGCSPPDDLDAAAGTGRSAPMPAIHKTGVGPKGHP